MIEEFDEAEEVDANVNVVQTTNTTKRRRSDEPFRIHTTISLWRP
jgi:hypothetical protein